jgi:hypothetical protein
MHTPSQASENLEQEKPKAARVMRSNPDQSSFDCSREIPEAAMKVRD